MKKYAIISLLAAACAFVSCEELSDKMSSDFPSDYTINYGLRQVLEYDPMNIMEVDLSSTSSRRCASGSRCTTAR